MTSHESRILEPGSLVRSAKYDLGSLDLKRISRRFVVFTPERKEIISLVEAARLEMGGGADPSLVYRIAQHNPDTFWAIASREGGGSELREASGYLAFLMLNAEGMRRLIDGSLDTTRPDIELIVCQNEKPAGIYVWGAYATGMSAGGIPLAFEKVSSRLYADVDLYSRAVTAGGRDMLEALGFSQGAMFEGRISSKFYSYRRGKPEVKAGPVYDSYREGLSEENVSVTVVHSIEEMLRVVAVRSAVYIAEQDCPYREEFEGNDFSGSHLLAYVGDEPAGCLRIRYFADFAKLERLAVLKRFRQKGLGTLLMRTGLELCRAKGYEKIYGRAQKRILKYYVDMGFRPMKSTRPVRFSGHDYVEIVYDAERHPHAITLGIDPYVLLRPEGRWHEEGQFDPKAGEELITAEQVVAA